VAIVDKSIPAEAAAAQLLVPQLQGRTREETKEIVHRSGPELQSQGVKSLEVETPDKDGQYDVLIESSPLRRFIRMVPAAKAHTSLRSVAEVVVEGGTLTARQLAEVEHPGYRIDPKTDARTELESPYRMTTPSRGAVPGAAVIVPHASDMIQVVSWATGDYSTGAATSHAERYFDDWIRAQEWKNRIVSIKVENFNLNPCQYCGGRLRELLQHLNGVQASRNPITASLTWSKPWPEESYEVIAETLRLLQAAGWRVVPSSADRGAYDSALGKLVEKQQRANARRL
jgi:hypothetical protein